jgi:hypothetical protein
MYVLLRKIDLIEEMSYLDEAEQEELTFDKRLMELIKLWPTSPVFLLLVQAHYCRSYSHMHLQ